MLHSSAIPIRNIWVLFLYASDLLDIADKYNGEVEQANDIPDLLGRLLSQAVEDRFRRNLSRGYMPKKAILSRVRGKIKTLETESQQLLQRGLVASEFEEHTYNIPRNRLVKAALKKLSYKVATQETAHRCRVLISEFSNLGVVDQIPTRAEMATDQIGRNENIDKLMVSLSKMVLELDIPSNNSGENSLLNSNVTEHLLRRLFEKAVGNALKLELEPQGWKVKQGRRLKWPIKKYSSEIQSIMPGMQTDIELTNDSINRHIIIDTKFTDIFTKSNYREKILKSGYLYQMYAYLRSQETEDTSTLITEGMFLHPQIGEKTNEYADIQGHRIHFKTIDLAAPINKFEEDLKKILY